MQPYINQNPINNERDHDFHDKCRKHLYQFVQVELKDGTIYQGILHSHDREKMYLLMPKMHHEHHHHNSMHHEHHHHHNPCIQMMRAVADSSFLSLDHLDCLASHSLESEDLDRFSRFLFKFNRKRLAVFCKSFL